jgi:two-component system chemotaxis response regulator CheB
MNLNPVRVLLVNDSLDPRRLVLRAFEAEPGVEVASLPVNGRETLGDIEARRPDVLVLDVDMTTPDALGILEQARKRWPALPVIVYSSETARGTTAALDALTSGANDYATKPPLSGADPEALEEIRSSLVPLVRTWGIFGRRQQNAKGAAVPAATTRGPRSVEQAPAAVVVIGASTGGPDALATVIPALPADLPVSIFLVQHMPSSFTKRMAERLDQASLISVLEAEAGAVVKRGHLYVSRGGQHLVLRQRGASVIVDYDDGPPENSCRPSVDVLFRSAVSVYKQAVLGVVLTGMGRDGLAGATDIRSAGGCVLVQDEASSVVWGMPGAIAHAGQASQVIPLEHLAKSIVGRVMARPRVTT